VAIYLFLISSAAGNVMSKIKRIAFLLSLLLLNVSFTLAQGTPIKLKIDATETPRNILHVHETMRVKAGPLTLFYPKWIPGEHTPTGTLNDMVNLHISSAGEEFRWQRDDVEMWKRLCGKAVQLFQREAPILQCAEHDAAAFSAEVAGEIMCGHKKFAGSLRGDGEVSKCSRDEDKEHSIFNIERPTFNDSP